MTDKELENFYREHLEEDIVFCLAGKLSVSNEKAMHLYYTSHLAEMINEGMYGIQYMDYCILTDILIDEIKGASPMTIAKKN